MFRTHDICKVYLLAISFFTYSVESERIIVIGIPKAGTHLLDKCITLLTNRVTAMDRLNKEGILRNYFGDKDFNIDQCAADAVQMFSPSISILEKCSQSLQSNEFLTTHLIYSEEIEKKLKNDGYRVIFILRDPRDQLVSRACYILKMPFFAALHSYTFDDLLFGLMGENALPDQKFEDLFTSHIAYLHTPKYSAISHIGKFYESYLPWLSSSISYAVKFEDLVGVNGGGDAQKQLQSIKNISRHLGISLSDEQVTQVINNLFGNTSSFREGKLGSWKNKFTQEHKNSFKKIAGQLLIDLGYETGYTW